MSLQLARLRTTVFSVWSEPVRFCSLPNNLGLLGLHEALQGLLQEYALEQDPSKKREILERMLDSIEASWEQLFLSLSNEQDPQHALLLLADFNSVLKLRRGAAHEADAPPTK